ncbi:MAG TPA: hypothetical protein VIV14_11355 [Gammaproteobacteria bacterium]
MRPIIVGACLTYCAACQPIPEIPADRSEVAVVAPAPATAETYAIDPDDTEIRILVYRAGPLANLGHNHVIGARATSGRIALSPELEDSSFELRIPVLGLAVDDPAARAAAGDDFASVPNATDIAGTRDNMLAPGLLDAQQHPFIDVTGRFVQAAPTPQVALSIRIKNHVAERIVPVSLTLADGRLAADADFEMTHEQLGLSPFSVMMGALRVAEAIRFQIRLVAYRPPDAQS